MGPLLQCVLLEPVLFCVPSHMQPLATRSDTIIFLAKPSWKLHWAHFCGAFLLRVFVSVSRPGGIFVPLLENNRMIIWVCVAGE
jgi:hypothetical protein